MTQTGRVKERMNRERGGGEERGRVKASKLVQAPLSRALK